MGLQIYSTPDGIKEKARTTKKFVERKMAEYKEMLEKENTK